MTRYVYDFSREACAVALKVGGRRSMFMRLRQKHLSRYSFRRGRCTVRDGKPAYERTEHGDGCRAFLLPHVVNAEHDGRRSAGQRVLRDVTVNHSYR